MWVVVPTPRELGVVAAGVRGARGAAAGPVGKAEVGLLTQIGEGLCLVRKEYERLSREAAA